MTRDFIRETTPHEIHSIPLAHSCVPFWIQRISFQQQTVLFLALRGPDGVRKQHPAKKVHIAYRGTIIRAAERGRFLHWGEAADSFMALDVIADKQQWHAALRTFFDHVDELPHHYVSHLAHAAQIIAVHHPHAGMRERWGNFYAMWVDDAHVQPESPTALDERLNDFGQALARLASLQPELDLVTAVNQWDPMPSEFGFGPRRRTLLERLAGWLRQRFEFELKSWRRGL